ARGLDVIIEQTDKTSVIVEADENLQQHITTVVENGVLKISSDSNIFNSESLKVTVQMPVISGLETASGASLSSANTLKSDGITVKASNGSEIEISVEADKVICETERGSHININGKA